MQAAAAGGPAGMRPRLAARAHFALAWTGAAAGHAMWATPRGSDPGQVLAQECKRQRCKCCTAVTMPANIARMRIGCCRAAC